MSQADRTAVIEMAAASGLPLLSESERNPMMTTTYGFGEMISDAVHQGCRSFILGIGGSATNDCGIGCLQALGFGFFNKDGKQVPYGANGLAQVHHIAANQVMPELHECQFHVACDVTNPLCGENGCSSVFATQKGADSLMVEEMEQSMQRFAAMVKEYDSNSDADLPGSGAAGGLGFALRTFLNAELKLGIDAFFPILRAITSAEDVMNPDIAKKNLADTAEQVFHLYHINRKEALD